MTRTYILNETAQVFKQYVKEKAAQKGRAVHICTE
jgi:hypothetical protein